MSARPGPQATLAPVLRLALELLAYNLLLLPFLPVIAVWVGWRLLVLRKPIGRWRHRLGLVPRLPHTTGPRIWVHAVSAGEMTAAKPVIAELRRRLPRAAIAVSTHTDTGMEVARKSCPEADALFYLPFDLPITMGLAMLRIRPDLVVLVEKELWPNLLAVAHLRGAPVLAVNGRVSDRMVRRARVLPTLVRRLYRLLDVICVQSEEDARRLRLLGLSSLSPRIVVAGNTKADTLSGRDQAAEAKLAEALAASESQLWLVAGSTHPGEEEQVVDAFLAIQREVPAARLLIAPRHLERLPSVSAMIAKRGLQVVRRSEGPRPGQNAVVVLDTMGELRAAYACAAAAFVGGTLVPIGGHNLLEPPAVGVPVLFGPHTENCADTADLLLQAGIGFRVADGPALARAFLSLARDREARETIARRAERLIAEQHGASSRCVGEAARLLARRGAQ
jgi:3-deoxy-D-manno-octulosonic-acid transferase